MEPASSRVSANAAIRSITSTALPRDGTLLPDRTPRASQARSAHWSECSAVPHGSIGGDTALEEDDVFDEARRYVRGTFQRVLHYLQGFQEFLKQVFTPDLEWERYSGSTPAFNGS